LLLALALFLSVSCGREGGEGRYRVVMSCSTGSWYQEAMRAVERERYSHPEIDLVILPVRDAGQQLSDIENLRAGKTDLLILSPVSDAWELTPVVEQVYEEGIAVILYDRKIDSDKYNAFVGADNFTIGRQMGDYLKTLLTDGGNVLLVRGRTSVTAEQERNEGFRASLRDESRGKLNLVGECKGNFRTATAREAVADLLEQLPEGTHVDAVVAFNDNMAVGARQAFDSLKFQVGLPLFLGVDALPGPDGGIEQVVRGTISASFIYPQGGKELMDVAAQILHGAPYASNVSLKSGIVDRSNVEIVKLQRELVEEQQAKVDQLGNFLAQSQSRYANQRTIMVLVASIAVLILALAAILYLQYRTSVKSRKELDKTNRELRDLAGRLEEANQAKLLFFTNISHEFKTPLSLIMSPLETLLDENGLSARGKDSIHIMQRNAGRLQALINEILDFRKAESGRMEVSAEPVDVEAFLREINGFFSDMVRRRQVRFTFETASGSYRAMIDKGKVEKIYFNLLSNAIKFVEDAGVITVRLHKIDGQAGPQIEVSVFNSDSYIPESELKDIFQRFYKIDVAKNTTGTGIGLALAAALTDVLDGEIFASSKEGIGTTFTFRLPFIPAEAVSEQDGPALLAGLEHDLNWRVALPEQDYSLLDEVSDGQLPTVLIIEDNADMRRHLKSILSRDYRVYLAESGEVGLQRAIQFLPGIILCDIMMPGIKGYEVCRTLKQDARTRDIPVILLSACTMDEQVAQGFESGADAYIMKPFSARVLKVRMKKLLEKAETLRRDMGTDWLVGEDRATTSAQEAFLSEIKKYIEKNLHKEINIQDLIDSLGMSKSKFYRDLAEITEYSPSDIINLIRIRKALNLMLTRNRNVSEAAAETGFSSTSYFCRVFAKYYKESPNDWLKHNTFTTA
jgi:signal transduction histidine kinase/DNA-binding response OmpR family regulator